MLGFGPIDARGAAWYSLNRSIRGSPKLSFATVALGSMAHSSASVSGFPVFKDKTSVSCTILRSTTITETLGLEVRTAVRTGIFRSGEK